MIENIPINQQNDLQEGGQHDLHKTVVRFSPQKELTTTQATRNA